MLLCIAAGAFLVFTGALGTGAFGLWARIGYWAPQMIAGWATSVLVSFAVERAGWFEDTPFLQGALIAAVLTAPLTIVVWLLSARAFGFKRIEPQQVWMFLPPVAVICAIITALNYVTRRPPPETHARGPDAAPAKFLARLPVKLQGARLFAVQAEDHYLRLHTSRGQDLILMRLADAVAELEGVEGARVHRSWWVAREGLAETRRVDGRPILTLKNGVETPVSRTYVPALREKGWL